MKKTTALLLAIILLMATVAPASAAEPETISPYYVNTSTASVSLVISENGLATWTIICVGESTAVAVDSVTYLERWLGGVWQRVDLGNENDLYRYNVSTGFLERTYTHQLQTGGKYRAVVEFTVYGTTEDETIRLWKQCDYVT